MKCNRCGKEITEAESHSYKGQALCDDCYIDVMQGQEKTCDPWATYLASRGTQTAGKTGVESLTDSEKKVYEFIKGKGKATKKEVMAKFGISAQDLDPQLRVLMHAQLITEQGRGDNFYLVPIEQK